MGREVRMVPPNWEHPKESIANHLKRTMEECYKPMYDRTYDVEAKKWTKNCVLWSKGKHLDQPQDEKYYWEWEGPPPNKEYYVPYDGKDATWFQLYETVSEGTPVSPPFKTKNELVDYLVEHGDFWDEKRGEHSYSNRKSTEKFIHSSGWAPSFVMSAKTGVIPEHQVV